MTFDQSEKEKNMSITNNGEVNTTETHVPDYVEPILRMATDFKSKWYPLKIFLTILRSHYLIYGSPSCTNVCVKNEAYLPSNLLVSNLKKKTRR